jgi:hypothetical protein
VLALSPPQMRHDVARRDRDQEHQAREIVELFVAQRHLAGSGVDCDCVVKVDNIAPGARRPRPFRRAMMIAPLIEVL